jgi:hypothetical protein
MLLRADAVHRGFGHRDGDLYPRTPPPACTITDSTGRTQNHLGNRFEQVRSNAQHQALPVQDGSERDFRVFLITARRPR